MIFCITNTNQTKSDCEVIIYLYLEYGAECVKMLDGIFGFVHDTRTETVLVASRPYWHYSFVLRRH